MENSQTKKILCIEDDYFIGEMYKNFLSNKGYDFTLESDGDKGLVLARNNFYDIILLDIMLPGKNGDEILDALRGKEDLIPNTKVIIMTNYQQPKESRQMLELKAEAYVVKTEITPTHLYNLIKELE